MADGRPVVRATTSVYGRIRCPGCTNRFDADPRPTTNTEIVIPRRARPGYRANFAGGTPGVRKWHTDCLAEFEEQQAASRAAEERAWNEHVLRTMGGGDA